MASPKISVDIEARLDNFERGLGKVVALSSSAASQMASQFAGIGFAAAGLAGVASIAAFQGKIKDAIAGMGELKDASERTGASVENLSGLKSIAKIGGRDFDAIEASISKLNKALHGTDDESKGAGKALLDLGLSAEKLRTMDPAEAFLAIAKAQEEFADGGGKSANLMAIMGKNAATLIPYMHDLAEQQTLIGKVTAQQASDADAYEKNIKRLEAAWAGLSKQMAAAVVGPAKDVTDWMVKAQKEGGTLLAIFGGLGTAMASLVGIEINPLKRADNELNETFTRLNKAKEALAKLKEQSDTANPLSKLADSFQIAKLEKEIPQLEKNLRSVVKVRDALVSKEVDADKPKSTALNDKTYGVVPKVAKEKAAVYTDLLTPAAEAYAKSIEKINAAELAADESTRTLNGAQKALFELMSSTEWARMPEAWQQAAIAQAAYATNAIEAANSQKRLNDMLAATPTEQIKLAQEDMILLADALERGAISAEQFQEAATKRLDLGTEAISKQKSMAEELGLTFTSAFEDAVAGGKSFSDVLKGIEQDIIKLLVRKTVTEPLLEGVKGVDFGSIFSGLFANAKGGVYTSPSLHSYANTVQTSPKTFAFANGGVFAEAGPEAIMPLSRGADGKLGVKSSGSAGVVVNINNNANGTRATQSTRQDAGGKTIIDVMIDTVKDAIAGDISSGGKVAAAMENQYALNRSAGAWR
jgi:hypothetical protein